MDQAQIDRIRMSASNGPIMDEVRAGRKVSAIRAIRQMTGSGLKEAKDVAEWIADSMCKGCDTVHDSTLESLQATPDNPLKAEPWDVVNVQELTDADILTVEDMKHLLASVEATVRRFGTQGVALALRDQDWTFMAQVLLATSQAQELYEKLQKLQGSRMIRVPF